MTYTVEKMTNYELITMYKRMLRDGLTRLALPIQEEIFMRMEEPAARPALTIIKGGIA
jgi:hypothetical protein